ncbi:unnamed protein product, partial [Mesorhabditis spiculigera]
MIRRATYYVALFLLVYMAGGKKAKHRDPEAIPCLLDMCKVKPHYDLLADDMSCSKRDAPNYSFFKFGSVRRLTYMRDLTYPKVTYRNKVRNFTGHPALLINEPYRHTRQQELDDPSIMRVKCLEQMDDKREHKCFTEKIRQHAIEDIAYAMSRRRAMLFGDMTSRRPARITSCDVSHDDERNPLMNKHVLIRRAPRIKPAPKVSKEVVKPLSLSESETQPSHASTPAKKPRKEKPESMKSYKELLFTPPNQELSLLLDATPVPTARIGESPGVYVTSVRMITDREQKKPTVTPLKSKTPLRTGRSGEEPKPPTRQLDTPEVVVQQLLGTDRRTGSRRQKSERQRSPKRKTGDGSGRADRPAPIDTKSRPKYDGPQGSGSGRSGKSGRNQ